MNGILNSCITWGGGGGGGGGGHWTQCIWNINWSIVSRAFTWNATEAQKWDEASSQGLSVHSFILFGLNNQGNVFLPISGDRCCFVAVSILETFRFYYEYDNVYEIWLHVFTKYEEDMYQSSKLHFTLYERRTWLDSKKTRSPTFWGLVSAVLTKTRSKMTTAILFSRQNDTRTRTTI